MPQLVGRVEFFEQLLLDHVRHESPHRSARLRYFAHQTRADIRILVGGHHEHSLQRGFELAIHERHLQFVLIVADRANAAKDAFRVDRLGEFHHQPVEGVQPDIFQACRKRSEHLDPLGHTEHRALLRVTENRDHQFFKDLAASLNQIEVPIGRRIKRTGIDRDAFVQSSSQEQEGLNRRFYAGRSEDGNWGCLCVDACVARAL